MRRATSLFLSTVLLLGVTVVGATAATTFPSKPITVIVPWAMGPGTDAQVRVIAKAAERILGQPIVVTNKTGGGGAVGLTAGMRAKPDGYTITTLSIPLSIIPHLQDVPDFFRYDAFKPLLLYNIAPGTVTVRGDSPWKTLEDFVQYAKANPGKVLVGAAPPGGAFNLVTHRLAHTLGIEITVMPYDGSGPAVAALLGGHIDATTFSPDSVLAQVRSGDFRVLTVLGDRRSPVLPDVPTLKELGYKLVAGTWRGFGVPKDTPDEIVRILQDAFKQALETEEVQKMFLNWGISVDYMGPAEFGEFMAEEYEVIGQLVKELGLK